MIKIAYLISLVILAWLLRGGRPERLAAVVILAGWVTTGLVDDIVIDGSRWGVALVDAAVLAGLTALALAYDRWWLLAAAAVQLLTVATHPAMLTDETYLIRTAVTIRWILAVVQVVLFPLAVMEARSIRRRAQARAGFGLKPQEAGR